MKNPVTPQDFGAVGNGKADDTGAFQKAVDSGFDVYVPTARRETYLITKPIRITKTQCKRIYSEPFARLSDYGAIIADFSGSDSPKATPLFDVGICSLRIGGLRVMSRAVNGHRAGVMISAMDESVCDYDIRIEHCAVKNFYRIACFTGRGLEISSSTIGSCNHIAELHWNNDADTNKNHPAEFDQRGISIKNCRLHGITSSFLTVKSGHAYGLHFEGNTIDNGRGYLVRAYGQAWGWNISGNVVQGINGDFAVMDFRKGMRNCVISGNTFLSDRGYWIGSDGTVDTWLKCGGDTSGCIIMGNAFKNAKTGFMSFNNLVDSVIIGNVMQDDTESTPTGITVKGKNLNTAILANQRGLTT